MSRDSGAMATIGPASNTAALAGMTQDDSCVTDPAISLLLLEDDEALRQMLVWELSELGYQVHAVGSCRAARAAVALQGFDLALFDIGLPDGDGAELAREMATRRSAPWIVLCSGKSGNPSSRPLPSKVLACLTKPVSICRLDALFRGTGRTFPQKDTGT